MKRILVVDSDMAVRSQIGRHARLEGYEVAEASDGYTAVALCRQNLAALLSLFTEKVMRNLEQDASAVAGVLLESRAAAVLQVDQNGQRIVQNLVMALTVDIGKRADATCIVIEFGAIKALLLSGICLHRDPPLDIRQSVE